MSETPNLDLPPSDEQVPSISAVENAYQLAMSQQSAAPVSAASPAALAPDMAKDVVMSENTPDRAAVCLCLLDRGSHFQKLIGI